jgi:uncharacterized protein YraI
MNRNRKNPIFILGMLLAVLSLVLSACSTPPATAAPTQDVSMVQTQSAQTVVADLTKQAPPAATETMPPPGATPNPSIPVAVIPTADPSGPSAIANYNTVIFSGPGTNYVIYAAMVGSQTAVVVGKSEDGLWWAINVPVAPNGNGWVSASWVTVTNADNVPVLPTPPVPPTTEMVPPGPSDPQATSIANTYIRTGPANNYPAYGIAPTGASGLVIGKSEDGQWWAVRLDPQKVGVGYGWVSAQYVTTANTASVQTIQNPDTYTVATPPPPASGAATGTATEYVNVRSGPGTNYPVLFVAPPGSTGEITGKSSDGAWWQFKISTQYSSTGFGWASASYVIPQGAENVPVVAAPPAPPTVAATAVPPASGMSCTLVSQTPADGTTYTIDTPFTTTWVLQNTGSNAWDQNNVDISYVGAYNNVQMHTGSDLYDLTSTVNSGATYNFSVSMIAPFNAGQYGEMWQVQQGSQVLCQFYVYITVP